MVLHVLQQNSLVLYKLYGMVSYWWSVSGKEFRAESYIGKYSAANSPRFCILTLSKKEHEIVTRTENLQQSLDRFSYIFTLFNKKGIYASWE